MLIEPGLRFDWDEIIRRPLFSPRLAVTYSPPGQEGTTKLSAGIGIYYEHTQPEYLERALAGIRYDTYYAADGVTPVTGPLQTIFTANDGSLHRPAPSTGASASKESFPARSMPRRISLKNVQQTVSSTPIKPGPRRCQEPTC